MRPEIYTVESIGSGSLAVMAKPVSGEWIEDEFKGIANENIHQIVCLLQRGEAYELGLQDEETLSHKNGIDFIPFPIQDRGLPDSVLTFSQLTKNLYHDIADGKNTVIHCRGGIGRTGMVAAGILLHCGFEPDDAFKHISVKRRVEVPDTIEQRNWVISNAEVIVAGK